VASALKVDFGVWLKGNSKAWYDLFLRVSNILARQIVLLVSVYAGPC
jgi:hypothetical protein